jgi:hypothetical protein
MQEMIYVCRTVFLKLWSVECRWSAAVRQVVRAEVRRRFQKKIAKIVSDTERMKKIHTHMSVLKLPLPVELQPKS